MILTVTPEARAAVLTAYARWSQGHDHIVDFADLGMVDAPAEDHVRAIRLLLRAWRAERDDPDGECIHGRSLREPCTRCDEQAAVR